MTAFLLDVNVLVALAWPGHEAHERVQVWFARNADLGWATCPFTQSAFVRILSNPVFSSRAVSPQEALRALNISLKHPAHRFWAADIAFGDAVRRFQGRLVGHKQVTDAYLLGLALHKRGKVATLDRSLAALLDPKSTERDRVEVIPKSA
ncbi:MAG TPA: TA system VapC family ribonuclease toxin [Terriglobales bacterium]|nr:TA system VapC family ribonuclease toxin [Terriglobales bacterium]